MRKNLPKLDTVIEDEVVELWPHFGDSPDHLGCSLLGMLMIVRRFGRATDAALLQELIELNEHR